MTRKVYKSAMGKAVDLGSLILQNESVRAVGNMNVNARGDLLDGNNRVIDQKNRQVQRQYQRTTNVSNSAPVQTGTRAAKQSAAEVKNLVAEEPDFFEEVLPENTVAAVEEMVITQPTPVDDPIVIPPTGEGGLAAAIARSRLIKQEKEKTPRERAQQQPIRKI